MKHIILAILLGLGLTAQAQYWTTNQTITTVTNWDYTTLPGTVTGVVQVTNYVVTPILVTNAVKCVISAQAEAELREVFQLMKESGEATGSFNAWFDITANQVVSQAMTSRSGELSAKKEERLLNLWRRASVSAQTNVLNVLK